MLNSENYDFVGSGPQISDVKYFFNNFVFKFNLFRFLSTYGIYMNLNVTKRPFGHFDVNVLKLGNSEKIMLYAFLK